jgi:hypothetical protein
MRHFFCKEDRRKISGGEITSGWYSAHLDEGAALPAFEPADDDYSGSHRLVEQVRKHIQCFDSVGGYEPARWEVSISNLFLLADLASAAALHMRTELDREATEDAEYEARRRQLTQSVQTNQPGEK